MLVRLSRLEGGFEPDPTDPLDRGGPQRPDAIVVGLHPGTVASNLSRPFRPDPSAEGVFQPDESAAHLLRVLGDLEVKDTGGVFAWDGTRIPA